MKIIRPMSLFARGQISNEQLQRKFRLQIEFFDCLPNKKVISDKFPRSWLVLRPGVGLSLKEITRWIQISYKKLDIVETDSINGNRYIEKLNYIDNNWLRS